jgi:hypothetical protein
VYTAAPKNKKERRDPMALFTIIHIYEVPARNQIEATDELMLARKHNFDKVFLKKVIVKEAGVKPVRDNANVFAPKPPASMKTIFKRQITGKW